jgi:hypothetical protein
MKTPPHVIVYRSVTVTITLLILLGLGLGVAGHGPLNTLHRVASPITRSLHLNEISG